MAEDKKADQAPDKTMPGDATPHNPGLSPTPGDPGGSRESGSQKTAGQVPYEKKDDPAQQPS